MGVGLRAQRHNDKVTRWYFVVDGRVGADFSLLGPDDRPLTRKQLVTQLGADAVNDRAATHRAAIDARLFGLGAQRYEQLLTLVLTLRRPQLAKHLDPKGLSRTLSDGLRPLDDELITEAARSFDDMEAVQRTLEGLVRADDAASAFLAGYTTYLRTHAKATADVVARRRSDVEQGRTWLATALATRAAAVAARDEVEAMVAETEATPNRTCSPPRPPNSRRPNAGTGPASKRGRNWRPGVPGTGRRWPTWASPGVSNHWARCWTWSANPTRPRSTRRSMS